MANHQRVETQLKFFFRLLPVVGLLCLVAGFGYAVFKVSFDTVSYTVIGVGLLLFLTLFAKAEVANLKYYLHVFVYSILVFGICIVAYLFAQQYTPKIDLTEQKVYSLSEQSRKYLRNLDEEVEVVFFAPTPDPFRELINLYSAHTEQLDFKVINPTNEPLLARNYGDTIRAGDVIIKSGDRTKKLSVAEFGQGFVVMPTRAENTLSNAIVEVTRKEKIKLYFLSGHGEVAYERPTSQDPRKVPPSLGALRDFLVQRGMETEELNLISAGFVPDDATMLAIAGPKTDLLPVEVTAIEKYLNADGKLLVLLDVALGEFATSLDNLKGLLDLYGIVVEEKIVLDMFSAQIGLGPDKPMVARYDETHPITTELGGRGARMVLSMCRPVAGEAGGPAGSSQWKHTDLLQTSPNAWSEDVTKVLAARGKLPSPDPGAMKEQVLGVAVEKSQPAPPPGVPNLPTDGGGARLVVFGTSELIQDGFLSRDQVGVELMLNTVNWLTEQEEMISVPPRLIEGTPIILGDGLRRIIFVVSVLLIPGLLFFGGVSYSLVRRRG